MKTKKAIFIAKKAIFIGWAGIAQKLGEIQVVEYGGNITVETFMRCVMESLPNIDHFSIVAWTATVTTSDKIGKNGSLFEAIRSGLSFHGSMECSGSNQPEKILAEIRQKLFEKNKILFSYDLF